MTRVAVFGWGLVAPGAANIDEFAANLQEGGSWLDKFDGFGPDTFLVGRPKFDFSIYEPWIAQRFAPSKSRQLRDKMDMTTLYAIGSFIQALEQNPGIESELQALGDKAHVYACNALGAYPTVYKTSVELYKAQRRWDRFWSQPERNSARRAHLQGEGPSELPVVDPASIDDPDEKEGAEDAWFQYWTKQSDGLAEYLEELKVIEAGGVEGDVAVGKMKLMRDKRRKLAALAAKWNTPEPPWSQVSANVLWNIPNTPASQISMLGQIKGPAFAAAGACSSFGLALKLGIDAIERGDAKLVVIATADPPPHPLTVGAFYGARVLSADGQASKPLAQLKGTHVAGGGCVWIIGDLDYGRKKGFKPLGLEPVGVGVSSDADHIITPSADGPRRAMRDALTRAATPAEEIVSWDLHATATPGDYQELENLQTLIPNSAAVSARKGTFGHGMGVGGGWELTAQYLGVAEGRIFATPLAEDELHPSIRALDQQLVFDQERAIEPGPVGKLSMGVGGVNACVISRPFTEQDD